MDVERETIFLSQLGRRRKLINQLGFQHRELFSSHTSNNSVEDNLNKTFYFKFLRDSGTFDIIKISLGSPKLSLQWLYKVWWERWKRFYDLQPRHGSKPHKSLKTKRQTSKSSNEPWCVNRNHFSSGVRRDEAKRKTVSEILFKWAQRSSPEKKTLVSFSLENLFRIFHTRRKNDKKKVIHKKRHLPAKTIIFKDGYAVK